jgi:hypothetical protein
MNGRFEMKILFHFYGLILSFMLLVNGCGYTQPYHTPPIVSRGNVIEIFPSTYFIEVLDSTQLNEEYCIIDNIKLLENEAMNIGWDRDGDAFLNVKSYRNHTQHDPMFPLYRPGLEGKNIFCGTLIKFVKNMIPCDSEIVTFVFKKSLWVSVTIVKYDGPVVLQIDDEKKEYLELETKNLEPGIYEFHVRAGENPLWTHRGLQWETSRWIQIVK